MRDVHLGEHCAAKYAVLRVVAKSIEGGGVLSNSGCARLRVLLSRW
jgi:hypothetical protein